MTPIGTTLLPKPTNRSDKRGYGIVLASFLLTSPLLAQEEAPADPAPAVAPETAAAPAPNEPTAEPQRFYIRNFRVLGTAGVNGAQPPLSKAEVEEIVYPFMGPYRTTDDVEDARAALEKAYQEKGYQTISVQTPMQSMPLVIKKGIVVLQVVQMRVGRLRVVGSRFFLPSEIKAEAPHLKEGTVPNFNDVTRDIVGLNQIPDRQVTPTLRAGMDPNSVDVDLNVKDKFPVHADIEINNRYSVNTSPLRVNLGANYGNLWQLGHTISLTYQVAPQNPSDAQVFTGSYLAPIPAVDGLSLLLYGLVSNSNVATGGSANVVGKGSVIGMRAIFALPSEKGFSENLSLGVDYKDFEQGVSLPGAPISNTPITYVPVSATYSATWNGGDGSLTQLDAGATIGLRGLGSSEQEFENDRVGASANFMYLRGDISRLQPLPKDFQLWAKMQGQLASEPLVNSEQISAGGLDTVRGYLESEALGDNGIQGQFEIRTSSIGELNPSLVNDWRLYLFTDAALLGLDQTLPQQTNTFGLLSVGAGTRIKLWDHFNGSMDAGLPLTDGPDTTAYNWRVTLRAQATF